jgi:hypothetical protein
MLAWLSRMLPAWFCNLYATFFVCAAGGTGRPGLSIFRYILKSCDYPGSFDDSPAKDVCRQLAQSVIQGPVLPR